LPLPYPASFPAAIPALAKAYDKPPEFPIPILCDAARPGATRFVAPPERVVPCVCSINENPKRMKKSSVMPDNTAPSVGQ